MRFEIRDSKDKLLSMDMLNLIVYKIWAESDKEYNIRTAIDGYYSIEESESWVSFLNKFVDDMIFNNKSWDKVIGEICQYAAFAENELSGFIKYFNSCLPYIEICLEFKRRGYRFYRNLTLY
jgi:hypothetical protein